MARDPGLEELVHERLGDMPGLSEASMFGSRGFLLDGNLLLATSERGVLLRVGEESVAEALAVDGVEQAVMGRRVMTGWVRVSAETFADDDQADGLLARALEFVRSLPAG